VIKQALFELRILATKARVCINDSFESKTVRDDSSSVRNTHVRQVQAIWFSHKP